MPSINDRLVSAVRRGDVKDVETLLNFGANPRCKDKTPAEWPALYLAVRHNHPECLRHLLAAGARHNSRASETNMTPLLIACEMGHLGCVHVLLGAGADPNAMDDLKCTPLLYAAEKCYVDIVYLLLKHGADASRRDRNGWTPLLLSCHLGHADIVELLLQYGDADTEVTDEHGRTPLMVCCLKEDGETWGHGLSVFHLVCYGANVRRRDRKGYTVLHYALENGCAAATEHLCTFDAKNLKGKRSVKANVDLSKASGVRVDLDFVNMVEPNDGNSALHLGCINGRTRSHALAFRTLLSVGANFKATNKKGRSPLSLAKEHGWPAIVRQLLVKLREHGHAVGEAKYEDVDDAAFGTKDGEGERSERALARYIRDRYHGRVEGGVDGLCSAYDAAKGRSKGSSRKCVVHN